MGMTVKLADRSYLIPVRLHITRLWLGGESMHCREMHTARCSLPLQRKHEVVRGTRMESVIFRVSRARQDAARRNCLSRRVLSSDGSAEARSPAKSSTTTPSEPEAWRIRQPTCDNSSASGWKSGVEVKDGQ
jgi:hypothetical protein